MDKAGLKLKIGFTRKDPLPESIHRIDRARAPPSWSTTIRGVRGNIQRPHGRVNSPPSVASTRSASASFIPNGNGLMPSPNLVATWLAEGLGWSGLAVQIF